MNRMNVRQRRKILIRTTTVLLFACLLIGAATVSNGENLSKAETASTPQILQKPYSAPLMYEASSMRRMAVLQSVKQMSVLQAKDETNVVAPSVMSKSEDSAAERDKAKKVRVLAADTESKKDSNTKVTASPEVSKEPPQEQEVESPKGFQYNAKIPMPKSHQAYLYKLCQERGLDYAKALAVIQHESQYDSNEISETNDYGYFQINKVNHKSLSKTLDTPNTPLDPYVNMQWGTYMLSNLYDQYSQDGIKGSQLDEYVWSSYNKGVGGFRRTGKAVAYIKSVREALTEVKEIL